MEQLLLLLEEQPDAREQLEKMVQIHTDKWHNMKAVDNYAENK